MRAANKLARKTLDKSRLKGEQASVLKRKRTEIALKDSETQLKEAQKLAHIGSWSWNIPDGTVAWSDELYRIFGLDSKRFVPSYEKIMKRYHSDDEAYVRDIVKRTLKRHNPFSFYARIVRPDKTIRVIHAHGSLLLDSDGNPVKMYGTAQDVTEIQKAQDDLRKSLSVLQTTLDSTEDGILVVDNFGKIVTYNRKFTKMWRIPLAVMASKDDEQAISFVLNQVKAPDKFTNKIKELYAQPDAESYDTIEFKDGRIFERYSQPQKLGIQTIGRVWSFRDITERKRSEAALARQTRELLQSNADLEQFAYVASHDLKEPLRAVAGYLQLLAQRYQAKLDEEADRYIGRAVAGAVRMQTLIEDLLSYSRAGRVDRERSLVDAGKVLRQVLDDLSPLIKESGARVDSGALPQVFFSETELFQIFQNLIGNALKFRKESPRIRVSCRREQQSWVFSVRDNGIGIDPKYFDRIFLIFHRLHGRQNYSGNGIGLAICKKMVEGRGGKIWVSSQPGRGSTFHFKIPI